MASILKVDTIQDQSGNNIINESGDTITIGASGDTVTVPTGASLTVPNGGLTGQNYPAFEAYLSADQTVTDATFTKVEVNTERFDTDSDYDNSTNYRFTPTVAGKYFIYAQVTTRSNNNDLVFGQSLIYKNGSKYARNIYRASGSDVQRNSRLCTAVIDMNGSSDYLEMFTYISAPTGTVNVEGGTADGQETFFGAYRLGA